MGITGGETTVSDDLDAIARARRTQCHQLRILHNIRLRGSTATQSLFLGYGGTGNGGEDGGKSVQELARIARYHSDRRSSGGYGSGGRSEGQLVDQDGRGSRSGSQSRGGSRRASQSGQDGGGGGYNSQYGEDGRRYSSQSRGGGNFANAEEEEEFARRNESFRNADANSRHSSSGVEELSGRKVSFGNRSSGVHSSSVFPSRSSEAEGMQGRAFSSSGGRGSSGGGGGGIYDPSTGRMTPTSLHPLHLKDVISEQSRPAVAPVAHPIELDESATNLKEELGWLKDLLLLYCVLGLSCLLFYLFFNDDGKDPQKGGGGACNCGPGSEIYAYVP